VIPGQVLNYRIEFENEGKGIAYGVYFTDTLSTYLDESTLKIGSVFNKKDDSLIARPGIYDPAVRTITWFVGEVGPGEGGYANFSIQVPEDAEVGSEILNYGIVYFPSAPEVTRTNGVVSIVTINKNPTAVAGTDIVVKTFEEIIFDGSGSTDLDGAIVNSTWDFGDGEMGYGKESTHSYPDDGNYKVELTVTDNWGGIDSHSINVKVLNRQPIAILEVTPAEFNTNELISFNAKSSFDLDGDVLEYYFDFGDNTNSGWTHLHFVSHKYSDGTKVYNVELSVKDDDDAIGMDAMNITINNVKPKSDFIVEPSNGDITTIFEFKSTSHDTDGKITNFFWSFGDGSSSNEKDPVHQYETKGVYTVSLVVQDDDGAESEKFTKDISIANIPPVAIAQSSTTSAKVGEIITFDATQSYDLDGRIIGLEWQFGDGNVAHGKSVQHSFNQKGDYNVVLIVLDDSDEFSRTTLELEIFGELEIIDSDHDGLPDSWEVSYGLNPNEPGDALLDLDGDSLTNLQEYDLGTDPTDSDTDDDSYPDNSDPYPLDPSKPGVDKREDNPASNINLLITIVVGIISLIIIILAMLVLKNKNKRIKKPFDTDEYIQQVRDDIIEGNISQDPEISDNELWTDLRNKYQNGQISEETYMLLEEEKGKYESSPIGKDLSGDMEDRNINTE
jgi:PKD repeat protein